MQFIRGEIHAWGVRQWLFGRNWVRALFADLAAGLDFLSRVYGCESPSSDLITDL